MTKELKSKVFIPENYKSNLSLLETEIAIKKVKDFFENKLAETLNLTRVSAPLFLENSSGLNDNLNGIERPVSFDMLAIKDSEIEILVIFRMNSSDDINIKGVKVAYVNRTGDMEYLAQLIKCEIQSELNTADCGVINESNLYKDINCNAVIVYGEYISNIKVMENFDSKKYGYMVAKACLAYKDKVLLSSERMVPKKMQKRAYRVCVGYYKDYDSAMDKVLQLNEDGVKDAYVVPYEGN